jgi:hypothetical protein
MNQRWTSAEAMQRIGARSGATIQSQNFLGIGRQAFQGTVDKASMRSKA